MSFHQELRVAESIARQAGLHVLRERARHMEVSIKAPNDLVTNVDRSSEQLITAAIREHFPGDAILGEEYGVTPGEDASQNTGSRRWLIDPIDGTANFAMGIPLYCVSIALQVDGQTVVGVIYEPNRDELFSARRGMPALLNGEPIDVSSCDRVANAVLVTGFPSGRGEVFERAIEQFVHLTRSSRGVRRLGSAAIDLAYVACGRIDAFWEYGLSPWDTGAGYLLVECAGGKITDIEGAPYHVDGPSILASNGALHHELQNALRV
ncbi:inositol monophosphatase [Lujinxingia litoralis]|uniref:Inositol-1-monophosphatase n=1 Tax=Lujinxingia litoralis TaxID=2211119 RepID=A0A328C4N0_9DELT|nr:inositol monophosphatase family protein [Lujinxingia litoralis]RAL21545.1 inositol monophosphatase [Lujinxingia litoralis]